MKHLFSLFLLLSICTVQAQIQTVLLTPNKTKTNEPSIAIDPNNPRYILAGGNVDKVFTSERGGMGWNEQTLTSPHGVYGDPVVHITKDTQYFFCHLSKTKGKEHPHWFDRIVFQRSLDRGATWDDGDTIGYNRGKMQDKPWIAVDENEKSPYHKRIYVSWTEFDKYHSSNSKDKSRIRFVHYIDSLEKFSPPITISDTTGNCEDDDLTLEGATTAVGKNGEVYVVWAGHENIYFDKSMNGGDSFGTDKIIAKQVGGWNQDVNQVYRANSMPFIQCNSKGHLFVVFGDSSLGDKDVFMMVSKDGGETWSEKTRINNDPIGNGRDQYMPNICLDPSDDKVYIVYYDRQYSSSNLFLDVTVAATTDGKKFSYIRATPRSFPPAGKQQRAFFGDYIDISASNGEVRPVFTDTEEGYITCKTTLMNSKMVKKYEPFIPTYMTYYQMPNTNKLIIHFKVPEIKQYKIEFHYRGNRLYSKTISGKLDEGEYEQEIDISKLQKGWNDFTLSFDAQVVKRKVMIF